MSFHLRRAISEMDLQQSLTASFSNATVAAPGHYNMRSFDNIDFRSSSTSISTSGSCTSNVVLRPMKEGSPTSGQLLMPSTALNFSAFAHHGVSVMTPMQCAPQQSGPRCMWDIGDAKVAGMKVLSAMMLNAYRKRRDDVKRLSSNVEDLTIESIQVKNQIRVVNTLFRIEQKRNDDLRVELERTLDDYKQKKSLCECLNRSVLHIEGEKSFLQQQVWKKEQDMQSLNTVLRATNSVLFKTMSTQRELQTNLALEQRRKCELERERNVLLAKICSLTKDSTKNEGLLRHELERKKAELNAVAEEREKLQAQLSLLDDYDHHLARFSQIERQYKADVEELQSQLAALKEKLAGSVGARMKALWQQSVGFQKTVLNLIHLLLYYTLPATPSPRFKVLPLVLMLQKALSTLKR